MAADVDSAVRLAVFEFLNREARLRGEAVFRRETLAEGIRFRGERVPLIGPQGIFKPALCRLPISITTVPEVAGRPRPYEDAFTYNGLRYSYRGGPGDVEHRDNRGLREAMRDQVPLVYFSGHRPGVYHAEWPVYVVEDDRAARMFSVVTDVGERAGAAGVGDAAVVSEPLQRAYAARVMQQRLHQSRFRQLILDAYSGSCAVCRLRHRELLDAAHILPDGDPRSEPVVSNGLALCRLHHGAFDAQIIGIRPDLVVEVRRDVLEETDGPMLRHGLQGVDRQRLVVPRRAEQRPSGEFLEERYALFRQAG